MKTAHSPNTNQAGFVSIVISLTVVIVLALITVAFSTLARREQQSSLDAQLSSQATYAAESGINDAIKMIDTGAPLPPSGTCQHDLIDPTNDVSYSCLLIDRNPPSLYYSNVGSQSGKTVTFGVTGGGTDKISRLVINWGSADSHNNFLFSLPTGSSADTAFKTLSAWGPTNTGMVQFNLTAYPAASPSRNMLIQNSFTTYLYPSRLGGGNNTINYPGTGSNVNASQASLIGGACNAADTSRPQPCESVIYIPNSIASLPGLRFAVHFTDYYDASNITIRAFSTAGGGGQAMKFVDGQALIDSTGRARDTLKRLQVRVPLNNNITNYINSALEAQGVCKKTQVYPGYANDDCTALGL